MTDKGELRACPFCGPGELQTFHLGSIYFVQCTRCDIERTGRTEADAAEAWNTRKALAAQRPEFQSRVGDWMLECFTPEITADKLERADRFCEEAMELCQTMPGFTAERAHALVDYVFGRDVGERGQEVGGVMVTLAALCGPCGIDMSAEAEREYARISQPEIIEKIRTKQAGKPTGSALPIDTALATTTQPDTAVFDEDDLIDEVAEAIRDSFDEEWDARDGARHVVGLLEYKGLIALAEGAGK